MLDNKGQALVEYLLIIALIVVVIIGLMTLVSGYLDDIFTKTTCDLTNKRYVEGEKPGDGYCIDFDKTEEKVEE